MLNLRMMIAVKRIQKNVSIVPNLFFQMNNAVKITWVILIKIKPNWNNVVHKNQCQILHNVNQYHVIKKRIVELIFVNLVLSVFVIKYWQQFLFQLRALKITKLIISVSASRILRMFNVLIVLLILTLSNVVQIY
jgi:hypothetical protein